MLTLSLTVISRKRTVRIKSSNHTCSIGSIMHNNNVLMSFNYVLCSPLEYLDYKIQVLYLVHLYYRREFPIVYSTVCHREFPNVVYSTVCQRGNPPLFLAITHST